ncbi:unnamed protein product [Didymodactylos carnosus]|uniref:Uncharacterized protein n=1 Tax=Didymodactylos carnosus TaxID=1234261 RepID=A0A813PE51_9BILA|nr:unnamed protein product [Didymodactylos carnosus]CAF3526533.1 unnamed protein product [Didymodactylos carnosus]
MRQRSTFNITRSKVRKNKCYLLFDEGYIDCIYIKLNNDKCVISDVIRHSMSGEYAMCHYTTIANKLAITDPWCDCKIKAYTIIPPKLTTTEQPCKWKKPTCKPILDIST